MDVRAIGITGLKSMTELAGRVYRMLGHHRSLPNNLGTHLQLSILRQILVDEIAYTSKTNRAQRGY